MFCQMLKVLAAYKNPLASKNSSPSGCSEGYKTSLNNIHLQTFDLHEECGAVTSLNSFFFSALQLSSSLALVQTKTQLFVRDLAGPEDAFPCWTWERSVAVGEQGGLVPCHQCQRHHVGQSPT